MRKNISVTNDRVLRAMEASDNASKLIEKAMIYYLDRQDSEYIRREEFVRFQEAYNKKVCTLDKKYTHINELLVNLAKFLKLI